MKICMHKPWWKHLFNTHINTDSESNLSTHDINVLVHGIPCTYNISHHIPENEKVFILKFYDIEPYSVVEVSGFGPAENKINIRGCSYIFYIFIG